MLKVKPLHLRENMVVAEPILDLSGKVLLEAKTKLTKTNIELLRTWDIDFIRIREDSDTDKSIEQELKAEGLKRPSADTDIEIDVDLDISQKIGISKQGIISILKGDIFGRAVDWKHARNGAQGAGTLLTREGVHYYGKFLEIIAKLLQTNAKEREFSIKEFNEVARLVTDYVLATPGVIAYALRPVQAGTNELARHLLSTAVISGKLAMLMSYSAKETNNIIFASLLHDVGKIGLPENLILSAGRRTEVEEKMYQRHVQLGLTRMKGRQWVPKEVLLAMAQHHERMDGKGFPMGSSGDKIHPYARIIAVADYVDEAARSLSGVAGLINTLPFLTDRFDPAICGVLRAYLTDFLMSNTLELEDGRTAQIVYMHQSFTEPVIRTNDGEFIDLNITHDVKIERYSV